MWLTGFACGCIRHIACCIKLISAWSECRLSERTVALGQPIRERLQNNYAAGAVPNKRQLVNEAPKGRFANEWEKPIIDTSMCKNVVYIILPNTVQIDYFIS
jgi:hypothetical protein